MDKQVFEVRFRQAAVLARDFAREHILEDLPDTMLFRVRLNSSYDWNLEDDETVYPGDGSVSRARELLKCEEDEVIDLLWRGGTVPEWADIHVTGLVDDTTLLDVVVCGRFTANEARLYHQQEGYPPFHAVGPFLPVDWEKGERFSIYYRSEAWSGSDVATLLPHAAKVWSLELRGSGIDDEVLGTLPQFSQLEILEANRTLVSGPGLRALRRQPRLRGLRFTAADDIAIDITELPKLRNLKSLSLEGLPERDWGFDVLRKRIPSVERLTLAAPGDFYAQGRCPRAERISLKGNRLVGILKLPKRAGHLSLAFHDVGPDGWLDLLAPVRELQSLAIHHAKLSFDEVKELAIRFNSKRLEFKGSGLPQDEIERLVTDFPTLRITS